MTFGRILPSIVTFVTKKNKTKQSNSALAECLRKKILCHDLPAFRKIFNLGSTDGRRTNADAAPLCPFRKLFLCIPSADLSAAKGFEGIVSSSLSCAVRLVATLLKEFSRFKFPSYVPPGMSAAGASQHFRYSAF